MLEGGGGGAIVWRVNKKERGRRRKVGIREEENRGGEREDRGGVVEIGGGRGWGM